MLDLCILWRVEVWSLPMSRHVPQHTFRCAPPRACHGGTSGTGDTGDTSAKHPRTRTIAYRAIAHAPHPSCHGGTWLAVNATNPGDMVRIPASKHPKNHIPMHNVTY